MKKNFISKLAISVFAMLLLAVAPAVALAQRGEKLRRMAIERGVELAHAPLAGRRQCDDPAARVGGVRLLADEVELHQVLATRNHDDGRSDFPMRPTW